MYDNIWFYLIISNIREWQIESASGINWHNQIEIEIIVAYTSDF